MLVYSVHECSCLPLHFSTQHFSDGCSFLGVPVGGTQRPIPEKLGAQGPCRCPCRAPSETTSPESAQAFCPCPDHPTTQQSPQRSQPMRRGPGLTIPPKSIKRLEASCEPNLRTCSSRVGVPGATQQLMRRICPICQHCFLHVVIPCSNKGTPRPVQLQPAKPLLQLGIEIRQLPPPKHGRGPRERGGRAHESRGRARHVVGLDMQKQARSY